MFDATRSVLGYVTENAITTYAIAGTRISDNLTCHAAPTLVSAYASSPPMIMPAGHQACSRFNHLVFSSL